MVFSKDKPKVREISFILHTQIHSNILVCLGACLSKMNVDDRQQGGVDLSTPLSTSNKQGSTGDGFFFF